MEITLEALAALVGGELQGPPDRKVSGLAGIGEAGPEDITFLANPKYARALPQCKAGVALVEKNQQTPPELAVIRVDDPYLAYAQVLTQATRRPYEPGGVHPGAVVDPSAKLGADVTVHPLATVGPEAVLGDRVVLHPGVHLGRGVSVGDDTELQPNVVVYHGCRIGKRCIIHAGTVIGADGFGFVPTKDGHFKIPQVGAVRIDDDVELGALNTVDRAATGVTRIFSGVKTDDMVHVAHNCEVGENTVIVAKVGISGSTKIGRDVAIGGQTGIGGHITIGDRVKIAARSGVPQSLADDEVVSGYPAMPHSLWLRTRRLIRKLPELAQRVKELEKRLKAVAGPGE